MEKTDKPDYLNKDIKKVSEVDLKKALEEVNAKNEADRKQMLRDTNDALSGYPRNEIEDLHATISRLTEEKKQLLEIRDAYYVPIEKYVELTEELEQAKKQSYEAGVMCQRRLDNEEIAKLREALKEAKKCIEQNLAGSFITNDCAELLRQIDSFLNQNKDEI